VGDESAGKNETPNHDEVFRSDSALAAIAFELLQRSKPSFSAAAGNAPVRIDIFVDLSCGMCALTHNDLMPSLLNEMAAGSVSLHIHDFPIGKRATALAIAARCAAQQNRYPEFVSASYAILGAKPEPSIDELAQKAGADVKKLQLCVASGVAADVERDFRLGQELEVPGTPTFFFNGQRLLGYKPFSMISEIIRKLISVPR